MIFMRERKLLFLKPRKCAGTSFEIALSKYTGPDDIVTSNQENDDRLRRELGYGDTRNDRYSLFEKLHLPKGVLARSIRRRTFPLKFPDHIPAKQARDRIGHKAFDDSFRVSIVRNPYEKMISRYYWAMRDRQDPPPFDRWIRSRPDVLVEDHEQYEIDGRNVIDFFIRFEAFEADILALEQKIPSLCGLYDTFKGISAKTGTRPKDARAEELYADVSLRETVRFFNKDIIEKFGYAV